MRVALTALTPQGPQDVLVSGDDDVTVGDVAAALAPALDPRGTRPDERLAPVISIGRNGGGGIAGDPAWRPAAAQPLWLNGGQADPRAAAARTLRDGAVVSLDKRAASATNRGEPTGVVEVRFIGGPAAGVVHRLGYGTVTMGASPDCHIRLAGVGVPAYVARLTVGPGGTRVPVIAEPLRNGPDAAPLLVDGEAATGQRNISFGMILKIGANVLEVREPQPPDAHLSAADDGGLAYNRPPRIVPPAKPPRIEVPAEPKRGERVRLQLLAALIPVVLGVVMVKVTHQWTYGLFVLMSPVMIIGQWMSDRRYGRSSHKKAMKEYRQRWAELDGVIAAARLEEEAQRRHDAPDPAEILLTATGPRRRLWERRAADDDMLQLRIGLADQPSRIEVVLDKKAGYDAAPPNVPADRDVPVTLSLKDLGVIGLAGDAASSRALARWLVVQAAALHSPRDLSIVILSDDPRAAEHWNWVRWLPHCTPQQGADCVAMVGCDASTVMRRVNELAAQAAERMRELSASSSSNAVPPHRTLVVLDGARTLRRVAGLPQVLATARMTGISAICLEENERSLPEECAAVVSWDSYSPAYVAVRGGTDVPGLILADQVGVGWADRAARALAPIRDISREDGQAAIPSSARLLDLLGMPAPSADSVLSLWQRFGRTTAVPIGVGADGAFVVDVRADGPHALIAGTTGAGKSELLQTLIASLAAANRPEAMNFVLIDYKGGSAFKDCARLPHTVGMVSDLDGHLTERALASLAAELKRREEILLHAGAKDIEDYWETVTRSRGGSFEPLPRLMLVIDEFASLVAELPDFVTGLVGIAQRGRSLGVHLVLATQRPAGVVSADIRANTNLRIALRVTDAAESMDVIDVADAAKIAKSTPGRCYVRSGASAPTAVQSARIGGRRPGAVRAAAAARAMPVPWQTLGYPVPSLSAADSSTGDMDTDLSVLVDAIAGAASRLGIPAQRSPWLEPLASSVTLDSVPAAATSGAPGEVPAVTFGLTDVPARQERVPLALDLAQGGHLVVAGAARSGRSTVLRTIAGSVAATTSPADVHIYGLDCGSGSLLPLSQLPHCGSVVSRDQIDRIERFIATMRGEITRRQQVLAASGFAGVAEQRAHTSSPAERLPWMLLLLDWWEGYVAAFEQYDFGRLIDSMLQILREGPAVGLRAVVTTDRSALIGQVGTVFQRRMVLNLADREDASYAGLSVRAMPAHQDPGRIVFLGDDGHLLEAQVALLAPDPSGPAQVAAIYQLAERAAARFGQPPRSLRPLRTDLLPVRTTVAETLALEPGFTPPSPLWALVGAGGDELGPVGIDIGADGPGVVVAGPPRSGRSTALLTMATSLLREETPVLVIAPRRSPLRTLAGQSGVLGVLGADLAPDDVTAAVADVSRYVIVVDDAELLQDNPASFTLEEIIVSGRDADHGLLLAGSTDDLSRIYSGFVRTALKSRCGLFVAIAGPGDGDLFGIRLPRGAGPGALGRGLLVRPGSTAPVQVALPTEVTTRPSALP
ncbi:MAG TPA: FtsK/SpoIIIE domain-containing protein [Trebonia sp.]|jgi:S-DNA-T family DNA segregation ATPase FtsK/SpoIIIE